MSYRNDRLNTSMHSLETKLSGTTDISKSPLLSDNGQSMKRMYKSLDYSPEDVEREESEYEEKLLIAEMRLVEAGLKHLVPVLLLIVENRDNREESMKRIPKRTYYRHRDQLLSFFVAL